MMTQRRDALAFEISAPRPGTSRDEVANLDHPARQRTDLATRGIVAAKVVVQLLLLWLLFRVGEWVVAHLHLPVPGNVFGMLLLFLLLLVGAVKEQWIQEGAGLLTKHLAFFFVPVAVGLMEWGPLFWREGHWLLLVLVVSTLVSLGTTGGLVQAARPRRVA